MLWEIYFGEKMNTNSLFDIVGPIMIGPSSSHTAGAVRIGLMARKIYNQKPTKLKVTLYNSFAKTACGHGTDKGLLGGIMGFDVDDTRIKNSLKIAQEENIDFEFCYRENSQRHPNSAKIEFLEPQKMTIRGNSVGAGEIEIVQIDDFPVSLIGNLPSLAMVYKDRPGIISKITGFLQNEGINIATLQCVRTAKGEDASMTISLDAHIPDEICDKIKQLPDMYFVTGIEALKK